MGHDQRKTTPTPMSTPGTNAEKSAALTPLVLSESELRRARLVTCAQARSAQEAQELLDMLGLVEATAVPSPRTPPPPRCRPRPVRAGREADRPALPVGAPVRHPRPQLIPPPFRPGQVRITPCYPVVCDRCGLIGEAPTTRQAAAQARAEHIRQHAAQGADSDRGAV